MRAAIKILFRDGVKDAQGTAVQQALGTLGFVGIEEVLVGKYITVKMDSDTEESRALVGEMCDRLLVNGVIEKYTIDYPEKDKKVWF